MPRDSYCADGIISHGERLVRKHGIVYFGGFRIQDEQLLPWVGKKVFVSVDDYFFIDANISDAERYTNFICKSPFKTK